MKDLYRFFDELAANNNRPWFEANRHRYLELRELWLADVDRMIQAMTTWEPGLATQTAKSAAYRIYRDTRFSSDKTPYKTHFSASVSPYGRKTDHAGYYIETGIARTYDQGVYAGLWALEPAMLRKLRHAIVDNIEEWEEIVTAPEMLKEFPDWCSSMLKTMPKGWDRNHPQAFYLRMTNYGKFQHLDRDFFSRTDWPEAAADKFRILKPMVDFLNYSMDE
ncbi:MAG: DUF2461 domain-containing protein [Paramuribaculum sp.]|nr:DUF2461 domain-containing protein [Paramuribaculum sp.]